MAAVIRYTVQETKTVWQGRRLVSSVNYRPESVYDDFLRAELFYHKGGGTMFYRMVQNFPNGEKVDPVITHTAAGGENWKFQLMNTIDGYIRYARSWEEFISLMRMEGYDIRWTDSRRNITYTPPAVRGAGIIDSMARNMVRRG